MLTAIFLIVMSTIMAIALSVLVTIWAAFLARVFVNTYEGMRERERERARR